MKVKAITSFNYGGLVKMDKGDTSEVEKSLAKKLIKMKLVEKVVISHKNIEIK